MTKVTLLAEMNRRYGNDKKDKHYSLILCGNVFVNNVKIKEPSLLIDPDSEIKIETKKYVSRGGYKLQHALNYWNITAAGKGFLDAGSSTGGFTDCLLQKGADFVHAVDVGYNQIDYSLRKNEKVILHEKTNIMEVTAFSPMPHIAVADLSFRSIAGAASKILTLVSEKKLIALIKPQFETEKNNLEKGIVKDLTALEKTLFNVIDKLFKEESFVHDIVLSPIKGTKGNIEFLVYITKEESDLQKINEKVRNLLQTES